MKYIQYNNADDFLKKMIGVFKSTESINGLMFGLCLQLKIDLFKYGKQPLFATIEEDSSIYIAALMTPPYKLQLCSPNGFSTQSIDTLVQGLMSNNWIIPSLIAEKHLAESFAQKWRILQNCKIREGMKQRIHELRHVQTLEYAPGEFRQAEPHDMDTVIAWARAFNIDCFGDTESDASALFIEQKVMDGLVFFWIDPLPVSIAARIRPTPNGESISFVYTPPEKRRHGYATSVVASLSQRILDSGKQFCCLYTDLGNVTSNSIYRKVGYIPVADVNDIHFEY